MLVIAACSFLFSLSETSIIGMSKIKLRHMVAQKVRNSQMVHKLIMHSDKFIVGILIGNNFMNIAFSVIVSIVFVHLVGERLGIVFATFFSTAFILTFCEILPKMLALKKTERMALMVAPIMDIYITAVSPLAKVFTAISDMMMRLLGIQPAKRTALITEEELRLMIEVGREEGVLSEEERKMLHRIFEFGDILVSDVMIPNDKMVAVRKDATQEDLLTLLSERGHSRIPVYSDSIENVVGIIYARDLLYILREKGLFLLQDLINPAYFVPAQTRVSELLRKFQTEKLQIAIIVDERKKAVGLVTLEDLLEEIVGEIEERVPGSRR
jgi:CBS domain containing-hemolysin-like protein